MGKSTTASAPLKIVVGRMHTITTIELVERGQSTNSVETVCNKNRRERRKKQFPQATRWPHNLISDTLNNIILPHNVFVYNVRPLLFTNTVEYRQNLTCHVMSYISDYIIYARVGMYLISFGHRQNCAIMATLKK